MVYLMQTFILSPQHFKLLPGGTAIGNEKLLALGVGFGFGSGFGIPIIPWPTFVTFAALFLGSTGGGGGPEVPHVVHFSLRLGKRA